MVEIFVTDVTSESVANDIINAVHNVFEDYRVNFDLEDCDHILRVESSSSICHQSIISLLEKMQVKATTYTE